MPAKGENRFVYMLWHVLIILSYSFLSRTFFSYYKNPLINSMRQQSALRSPVFFYLSPGDLQLSRAACSYSFGLVNKLFSFFFSVPAKNLKWFHNRRPITAHRGRAMVTSSGKLRLVRMRPRGRGVYRCSDGKSQNKFLSIQMKGKIEMNKEKFFTTCLFR